MAKLRFIMRYMMENLRMRVTDYIQKMLNVLTIKADGHSLMFQYIMFVMLSYVDRFLQWLGLRFSLCEKLFSGVVSSAIYEVDVKDTVYYIHDDNVKKYTLFKTIKDADYNDTMRHNGKYTNSIVYGDVVCTEIFMRLQNDVESTIISDVLKSFTDVKDDKIKVYENVPEFNEEFEMVFVDRVTEVNVTSCVGEMF